jgi:uncharacterized membrane protein YdbT with pleckstrin-like domain
LSAAGPAGSVPLVTFPRRLLIEGEELVLDLRPHWIALVRAILVVVLVAAAWIVLLPRLPGGVSGDVLLWLILGVGVILLTWYALRDVVEWLTSNFVVTTDRVIHREGFIAKRSMEIPLEAINDVRFQQGIFERIIGAGTLVIHSASEAGRQEFADVRDPETVQKTIYHQGELNQQRMRGSAPVVPQAPSMTTELQRLADLRERGVLTEDEFQDQKARILGRPPS